MTPSGVTLCSWNSPASSAGNTGFYLSRSVSTKQSGWTTEFGDCRNVCSLYKTHVRDTSDLMQRLNDTWASIAQNVEAVGQWRKRFCACVTKTGTFQSQHSTQPTGCLQSHSQSTEENTLFRVVSIHSHLRANKISKGKGIRKVEYAYHF